MNDETNQTEETSVTTSVSNTETTSRTPKKTGRPKKDPVLFDALTIEERDGQGWFTVALTIDRNTNKVVDKKDLLPRGTSKAKAILNIEPFALKWRFVNNEGFNEKS